MRQRRLVRISAVLLTAQLTLAGCDVIRVGPPGMRQLVIPVENMSALPARLFVAEDGAPGGGLPVGRVVGTAVPDTVLPGVRQDVVFTVPSGDRWVIFVNPGAQRGGLIGAHDVPPDVRGATPLSISVGPNGDPSVTVPDGPGWFGGG
jgi:hypothetical protein